MLENAFAVSRETSARLDAFLSLALRWNQTLNLISQTASRSPALYNQIHDALGMVAHLPPDTDRIIDLGSGGGFPGIPIAIVTGIHVDLIEADRRKAAFLETALASLNLSGKVWAVRIENCRVQPSRCITARALAPLSQLLAYSEALFDQGAVGLYLKGQRAEAEIAHARDHWNMNAEICPLPASTTRLVKVSRLQRANGARP